MTSHDMKVGIVFPHADIGNDPETVVEFVQSAERLGYTHLRVYDHVLGAVHADRYPPLSGPYTEDSPFHEPMVLFGFLAGVTSIIELVAGVLILPQRQTALVAKQAAEVDLLSRGRLRLGVGTGWNYVEYESLNEDFTNRGRRIEEQIKLLRALWQRPVLDFTGSWHRIDRAGILPRPSREIPIWMGGFAEVARRRAVRMGDGFMFGGAFDDAVAHIPVLRAEVETAGRELSSFGIDVLVHANRGLDRWRADYETCRELGVSHITVSQHRVKYASHAARLDALAAFLEAVC